MKSVYELLPSHKQGAASTISLKFSKVLRLLTIIASICTMLLIASSNLEAKAFARFGTNTQSGKFKLSLKEQSSQDTAMSFDWGSTHKYDRIIKVTMSYPKEKGNKATNNLDGSGDQAERLVRLHRDHADRHGHGFFVGKANIFKSHWTKHAILQHVLLTELLKEETERAEWIFWCDLDTVVMNPLIPLGLFLPPQPNNISMLVTSDGNGLNDGVFFLRVSTWALELFSATQGYKFWNPPVKARFNTEQATVSAVLQGTRYFGKRVVEIPRQWVNSYPWFNAGSGEKEVTKFQPGYFLVHMAGPKDQIPTFLEDAESENDEFMVPLELTGLLEEVEAFWHAKIQ